MKSALVRFCQEVAVEVDLEPVRVLVVVSTKESPSLLTPTACGCVT